MKRSSIVKKTFQVSFASLLSKFMGIVREVLLVKFLGISQISDAFIISYKIPDLLRKVFSEGALSVSFIPSVVQDIDQGKDKEANQIITLLLLIISSIMIMFCFIGLLFSKQIILFFAPGFLGKTVSLYTSSKLLSIFVFLVLFLSISALFAGAMHAKEEFVIPSLGGIWLNLVYITGILICLFYNLSVYILALFISLGAFLKLIFFYHVFRQLNFRLIWPNFNAFKKVKDILLLKFLPCFFTISLLEIYFLIDARFASMFPKGSVTLLTLAFKFKSIALGSFSNALASILLPHFSKLAFSNPKRVGFYLLEAAKLIFWVTVPLALFMSYFSKQIFLTIFYKFAKDFSFDKVTIAAKLLNGFILGLIFYSLNKLMVSIYYSFNNTLLPLGISVFTVILNVIINFALIKYLGIQGIPIATSLAIIIQCLLLLIGLSYKLGVKIYIKKFLNFSFLCILCLLLASLSFLFFYKLLAFLIKNNFNWAEDFLLNSIGLWIWLIPLFLGMFYFFYRICRYFGLRIYFLN